MDGQHESPAKSGMTAAQRSACTDFLQALEYAADALLDATALGDPARIYAGDVLMYARKQYVKWVNHARP
jgi:hypothetical protein